jgi:segregation and condensation protein B
MSDLRLVTATLQQLQTDYDNQRRGLQIIENTQGFQMATRELFGDLILNLRGRKRRPSLSQAALETMAIIAYRQPIIRAEVEAVRGVESSGTIRNLIDMGLVEMVGRKDVIGRPPMYGTTETFLNTFGLKQIDDLPSIGELKRHADESDKEKEAAEIETARAEREKAEKEASQAAEDARAAREQAAREQQIEIEREKAAIAAIDDDDEADNWDDESPDETLGKPEADESVIKNETELEDGEASDEDDSLEDALGLEDEMDDENEDVFDDDPDDIGEIDDARIVDDVSVSESADDDLDLEDDLIQGEDDDEDDFDDEDFDEDEDEDDFDEDENEDEERPVDSETGDEPGDESRP